MLGKTGVDGMFGFAYIVFMAMCACDEVNCVGGDYGKGTKGGKCCICIWIMDELPVSKVLAVFGFWDCCVGGKFGGGEYGL